MATDGSPHLKELLGIGWFAFLNFHHIKRIEEEIGHYRHNQVLIFLQILSVRLKWRTCSLLQYVSCHNTVLSHTENSIIEKVKKMQVRIFNIHQENMVAGGKNYWSRWHVMNSSEPVQTPSFLIMRNFFLMIFVHIFYPNITLKISSMKHSQFYITITHALCYKLEIRMMLRIKLQLNHKTLQRYP